MLLREYSEAPWGGCRTGFFGVLPRAKNGARPKKRKEGEGKETFADKPLDFVKPPPLDS